MKTIDGWSLVRLMAMLSMVIDHIAWTLPVRPWLAELCHTVCPMTLGVWVLLAGVGAVRSRDARRYAFRLFMWAGVSQIPHFLAFGLVQLNVLFTLAIAVGSLWISFHVGMLGLMIALFVFASVVEQLVGVVAFDWGSGMVAAILLTSIWWRSSNLPALFGASVVLGWAAFRFHDPTSLMPVIVAAGVPVFAWLALSRHGGRPVWMRGWVWYVFYPVHLLLLVMLGLVFAG